LNPQPYRLLRLTWQIAVLALASLTPAPARADFFDGARRTFTNDIPHFFQDDIPCAFGGQPTSHTRTACKSSGQPATHTSDKAGDRTAVRPYNNGAIWDAPPSAGR
jgi:hypothetical protein